MSDRPRQSLSRRQFLKLAGAAALSAAAGEPALHALGRGPGIGVAHAQEEGQEGLVERYKTALQKRVMINGERDPIGVRFSSLAILEIREHGGMDVLENGAYAAPTAKTLGDSVYFRLQEQYGAFSPEAVAGYLVEQYAKEFPLPGSNKKDPFFIKQVVDQGTGQEAYVVNLAAWADALDTMPSLAIPFAVLHEAKGLSAPVAAAEKAPLASEPTRAPASEKTPVAASGQPTEAGPLTPEQKKAQRLIPWILGFFGTGLTLLGLGWLVGRKPVESSGPSPLGQVRADRAMTSADRAQRVARAKADRRARFK